jgi:membrane protein implicated in regulation of membrane protease activity
MDYRGVLLTCAVVGATVLGASTACSGPDPGAITFSERPGQSTEPQGTRGDAGTSGGASGTSDGGTTTDPAVLAFFKNEPFAYQDPGLAANNADAAHGGTVEGKNCIVAGCHLDGGRKWLFGGTVYTAPKDGQTVAKAEVRVVGPDGTEIGRAYTDANGNFWLEAGEKTIPAGSKVGVRAEGGAGKLMATPISNADGGCSAARANCHGTDAQGKVWVK